MKFSISNLGPIDSAEMTLAPLTVLCGKNNTGKTYASYSLFCSLDFIRHAISFPVPDEAINDLLENGEIEIGLDLSQEVLDAYFDMASKRACAMIPVFFAAEPSHFKHSKLNLSVSPDDLVIPVSFSRTLSAGNQYSLQLSKPKGSQRLTATLLRNGKTPLKEAQKEIIESVIGDTIKEIIFKDTLPAITFTSTERTGALMFRDELTPEKGKDIKALLERHPDDFDGLVEDVSHSLYPFPIIKNINFVKNLRSIALRTSPLAKRYPGLVTAFDRISGGRYSADENGIFFSPADTPSLKLAMEESSSSARSLVLISFWLRHLAKKGDLLMIDEPEMNLHPESQRLLARWVAMLVNCGVKVFITTHSDYFIKELNTLVMLRKQQKAERSPSLMEENGISKSMLLNPKDFRVYVAKRPTKTAKDGTTILGKTTIGEAPVDSFYGAAVSSFDDTISRINELQEAIIFNG